MNKYTKRLTAEIRNQLKRKAKYRGTYRPGKPINNLICKWVLLNIAHDRRN